ncbi:MAG: NUDIX hydrolase [Planctomycetota bacterium]
MSPKASRSVDFYSVAAHVVAGGGAEARYLLLRRSGDYLKGNWQMVVGRIEKGEKAWKAVLREIREETGFAPRRLYNTGEVETFYEARGDRVAAVPTFLALVEGPGEVHLSPSEHDAYEWLSFEEAIERLEFPQQRRVLRNIHKHFVLNVPSERLRLPV